MGGKRFQLVSQRRGKADGAWPLRRVEQQDGSVAVAFRDEKRCLAESVGSCTASGWAKHCWLLHEECVIDILRV